FAPDVTSYDYDAPINEYGQTTPKYDELRALLQQYSDKKLPAAPKAMPITTVSEFKFTEYAPLFSNLPTPIATTEIKTMEEFDQGWGSILYSTTLPEISKESKLHIEGGHDFVQVFIDNKYIGKLDRVKGEKDLVLPSCKKGAKLDILVEAMGRINFGRAIKDFKGIEGTVDLTIDIDGNDFTASLKNWKNYLLPDTYEFCKQMTYKPLENIEPRFAGDRVPGYYKATFNVKKVGDTFINMETFGKGLVYVNGHGLGRFWEIGPQQTLYCPGCWLKKGENEIIVLDIVGPTTANSECLAQPLIDKLNLSNAKARKNELPAGFTNYKGNVEQGSFSGGNGWKEIKFAKQMIGRYIEITALNNQDGTDLACVAELYLLDPSGKRISREDWKVVYCDSEETEKGNYMAEKAYDLQESTYWSTNIGKNFPHTIVIDLGKEYTLSALQYLPRMESNVPGCIKDYKIRVCK
ncbi:MAG: discoidin domain-containing protein, partial [Bacteroidaceae bacterium]|nr:discoidin domain-containing protein [Bacteroidaceae bacterium]